MCILKYLKESNAYHINVRLLTTLLTETVHNKSAASALIVRLACRQSQYADQPGTILQKSPVAKRTLRAHRKTFPAFRRDSSAMPSTLGAESKQTSVLTEGYRIIRRF